MAASAHWCRSGDAEALAAAIARTLDEPLPAATLKAGAAQYRLAPVSRRYLAALGLTNLDDSLAQAPLLRP